MTKERLIELRQEQEDAAKAYEGWNNMNDNAPSDRYEIVTIAESRPWHPRRFAGWFYVIDPRRKPCDKQISVYFPTRAQAERCRDVLIEDDRRRDAGQQAVIL